LVKGSASVNPSAISGLAKYEGENYANNGWRASHDVQAEI